MRRVEKGFLESSLWHGGLQAARCGFSSHLGGAFVLAIKLSCWQHLHHRNWQTLLRAGHKTS